VETEKNKYIILDFSCGRYFTHHSAYLKDFYDFLISQGIEAEVWVNTSADLEILELFGDNVKACLRSNLYSHSMKSNFLRFLLDKLVNGGIDLKKSKVIKSLLVFIYTQSALREFKKNAKENLNLNLLFPTLDGLGLQFIKRVLNNHSNIISLVAIRVTNAETRGIFGENNSVEFLQELITLFPKKIHLGYEVEAFKYFLESKKINSDYIFWSPVPYINRALPAQNPRGTELKVGFIGSARKNKGFDDIPEIIFALKQNNITSHFYIQLPKYKWPEFDRTFYNLSNTFNNCITFLECATSKTSLDNLMAEMDIVILPYRKTTYQLAGSGILFLAADFNIPIASYKDLAFNWDIEFFNLGFTFSNLDELISQLSKFNKSDFLKNFKIYNARRNDATKYFLKI
jgi:hypothetical protein